MKNRIIQLIPISILAISIIYLLIQKVLTNVVFEKQHYIGIIFTVAAIIAYCKSYRIGNLITGIALSVGIFRAAFFTPTLYYFSIAGNELIDLFCLPVMILFLIINHKKILNFIGDTKAES